MKNILQKLNTFEHLSKNEAYQLMLDIEADKISATHQAALMAFLASRQITIEELSGFKQALLDLSVKVSLDADALDVCGTGGDQKNTFNISTLSALVLAASGVPIAKHGNFGSSSISGSSDILAYFGYKFKTNERELNNDLIKHNLCFIHAPLFHPALKKVAATRKELGIRTFFNLLGPLINPSQVKYKYIGVYNLEIARLYNYILQNEKASYTLVNSVDGYDEISLTSAFKCFCNTSEKIHEPRDFGFDYLNNEDLDAGTSIEHAAQIFLNVLEAKSQKQMNTVIINSAFAMHCYYPEHSIQDCIAICKETLQSGKALNLFKKLIN